MVQQVAWQLTAAGLKARTQTLLEILEQDPYLTPSPFEKPVGDLTGVRSRGITIQHRLVCQILEEERMVKVLRT